jgi:uncharacterized protein YpmS
MTLLKKCKYLIAIGILFCIVILAVLYIKNMIHKREKLEQFNAEVKVYHNTSTTATPDDNRAMLNLAKLTDKQNADSKYDQNIDESHLTKA